MGFPAPFMLDSSVDRVEGIVPDLGNLTKPPHPQPLSPYLMGRGEDMLERLSQLFAAARFFASRSSTRLTISSSVPDCKPSWRAMRRIRQSTLSMCSAPPKSERAADD